MTKAENIRNQCMKILDKYDADYRGVTVERIDGTTYVVFKYYGGTNDTIDRNDDSWDEISELDGVVDVGYGEGYGIKGKYEDSLLIELDEDIVESKKSARKSIKESNLPNKVYDVLNELVSNFLLDYGEFVEFERNGLEHHFDKIRELGAKLKKANMKGDDDLYQKIADEIVTVVKRANGTLDESKKSARKSLKESQNDIDFNKLNGFVQFKEYRDSSRSGGAFSEIKKLFEKENSFQNIVSLIKDLESDFELTKFTFLPNGEINISFKEVGGNFEFFVKYEIYRSGVGLTNLRYF